MKNTNNRDSLLRERAALLRRLAEINMQLGGIALEPNSFNPELATDLARQDREFNLDEFAASVATDLAKDIPE